MSKWTRTRRDPTRTYIDDETRIRNARIVERMRTFLEEGTIEDEPAFVQIVKDAIPKITKEELKKNDYAVSRRDFRATTARSRLALNLLSDS